MKVYNKDRTQILTEYDLDKGHLVYDTLTKHVEAIEPVEEQFHYETIAEYPNGGKDVKKVIDVAAVKGVAAYDEIEEIQIYIPYTEDELIEYNQEKYERRVEALIRQQYGISQELALLRQRDTKPIEFKIYNDYVEDCKAIAKKEFFG